jgi:hypothetical protein
VRDVALDSTGDLAIAAGKLRLTATDVEATAQRVKVRLALWRGEWIWDRRVGTPWLSILGLKNRIPLMRTVLREGITSCPGIARLDRFDLTVNAQRDSSVRFVALTTGGAVVTDDFIAGAI